MYQIVNNRHLPSLRHFLNLIQSPDSTLLFIWYVDYYIIASARSQIS